MLPGRYHLNAARGKNPFLKKKSRAITYAEKSNLGDWLGSIISPSDWPPPPRKNTLWFTNHNYAILCAATQNALNDLLESTRLENQQAKRFRTRFNERADRWERQDAIMSNPRCSIFTGNLMQYR